MNRLLVWELVPEETKYFSISDEAWVKYQVALVSSHGRLINACEEEFLESLLIINACCTLEKRHVDEIMHHHVGAFKEITTDEVLVGGPWENVICTGCVL